jgi:predicted MPP superfamily phosphohydrolase
MKQLVQMMEQEGFYDADTNENYRQMLKQYQKSIGELPEAPKYADMVVEGKLESIKELVGEIAYEKRENQHVLKQLNQVKREVLDFTIVAEQIGQAFKSFDWSQLKFKYNKPNLGKTKMIVSLSDLHIGALVDTDINKYNYAVAQQRMQKFLDRIISEIKYNAVSEVYLMNVGDVIENPYMHNLAFNCEFTASEQIVRASDIIIKFMIGLSEHVHVTVAGIAGNHDRYEENKNVSLDGDHAVRAVNYAIKSFIENSKIQRITYEQAKDYEHSININGLNVKFVHGDLDNINDQNLIAKHSAMDGINYNLIIMGHYHHFWLKEQGLNKTVVGFGTLKGSDGYSVKVRKLSSPSQGFIIVDEHGNYDIFSVKLA